MNANAVAVLEGNIVNMVSKNIFSLSKDTAN